MHWMATAANMQDGPEGKWSADIVCDSRLQRRNGKDAVGHGRLPRSAHGVSCIEWTAGRRRIKVAFVSEGKTSLW